MWLQNKKDVKVAIPKEFSSLKETTEGYCLRGKFLSILRPVLSALICITIMLIQRHVAASHRDGRQSEQFWMMFFISLFTLTYAYSLFWLFLLFSSLCERRRTRRRNFQHCVFLCQPVCRYWAGIYPLLIYAGSCPLLSWFWKRAFNVDKQSNIKIHTMLTYIYGSELCWKFNVY